MDNAATRLQRGLNLVRKKLFRNSPKRRSSWRRGLDKLRGRHRVHDSETRRARSNNAGEAVTIPEAAHGIGRQCRDAQLTTVPSKRPEEETNVNAGASLAGTRQPQNPNPQLPTPTTEDINSESERDPHSPTYRSNRDSGYASSQSQLSPETTPSSTLVEADWNRGSQCPSTRKKKTNSLFSRSASSGHRAAECSKTHSPPSTEASVANSPAAPTPEASRPKERRQVLDGGKNVPPTITEASELNEALRAKITASGFIYHEPADSKTNCQASAPATFSDALMDSKNRFKEYEESRQKLLLFADWYDDEACDQLSKSLTDAGVGPRKLRLGQGDEISSFIITVHTETTITVEQQETVRVAFKSELEKAAHIRENFTADLEFKKGSLTPERTGDPAEPSETQKPSNRKLDSQYTRPCNATGYKCPRMGDSISEARLGGTGTLGPIITMNDTSYYIVPWHLFDNHLEGVAGFPNTRDWDGHVVPKNEPLTVVHPSAFDMSHDQERPSQRVKSKTLGGVKYYSGRIG